ncbi:Hint domain-containing protein [Roseovarius litorisediminis]|nr:Hint domain-containing protein [Roseovarius litorisediminis]
MRKYQISYLKPDGSIAQSENIGPATPAFEAAFSAFARGTLIQTTQGPIAVEDLVPGMKILSSTRTPSRLLWIGSMALIPNARNPLQNQAKLTRFMADSLGMGRPISDFMAGPSARILTRPSDMRCVEGDGRILVPARDLADGMNIIELSPPRPVTAYHLCLQRHATVSAAGFDVETFHPGHGFERNMGHNMLSLFLSFFPHVKEPRDFGSLSHPRRPLISPSGTELP